MTTDLERLKDISFPVTPFKVDRGFEVSSLFLIIAGLSVLGAVLGAAAFWLSQYFYLVILFPILIGFALAFLGNILVKKSKTRNPLLVAFAGTLGAVFAVGVIHVLNFQAFSKSFATLDPQVQQVLDLPPDQLETFRNQLPEAQQKQLADMLEEYAAKNNFIKYMDVQAHQGVTISRRSNSSGINLGYVGTYIYWLVEILIVGSIVFFQLKKTAGQPFCQPCHQWKESDALGFLSGDKQQVIDATKGGRLAEWLACSPSTELEHVENSYMVTSYQCGGCKTAGGTDVAVDRLKLTKKKQIDYKLLHRLSYPGAAAADIKALFPESEPEVTEKEIET